MKRNVKTHMATIWLACFHVPRSLTCSQSANASARATAGGTGATLVARRQGLKQRRTIIEIHNFVSCEINPPYAVPSLYVNRPPIAVLPSASAFRSYTYSDFPLGLQDSHCPYLPGLASCRLGKRRQASNRRQHGRQALSHD